MKAAIIAGIGVGGVLALGAAAWLAFAWLAAGVPPADVGDEDAWMYASYPAPTPGGDDA